MLQKSICHSFSIVIILTVFDEVLLTFGDNALRKYFLRHLMEIQHSCILNLQDKSLSDLSHGLAFRIFSTKN
jgi:hypothetical protein